jgi:N-methylhydantoinase A/oxoprolinase/acetone carboxylase beta subunit
LAVPVAASGGPFSKGGEERAMTELNGHDHRFRLGFDIGGTFTDFVAVDEQTGAVSSHKVLTSADDPSRAVMEGLTDLLASLGAKAQDLGLAIHGTTLITNALIERKGARTALVTTAGFRDVLEMGKEMRYDIYDLRMLKPEPLVPRQLRLEVTERLDKDGNVLTPLDGASVDAAIAALRESGVETVGVCFLHSFRNSAHEQAVGEAIAAALPGLTVSLSSTVAPEIREYERMNTTVSNAYVQPLFSRYVGQIQRGLAEAGSPGALFLMLSSGGITSVETAVANPIRLVESGPAAGALVSAFYGERMGRRNLISFDMGGTTAKICLIKDGRAAMASTFEIARVHRFKKGSGLPVRVPSIELVEIGAGGGSIARVDDLGLLKVGPESAGSSPGPACYGFGGERPTVTDANLLLGYLNPDFFLGGRMSLDVAAAERAVESVGAKLGLDRTATANGIFQVVNESMISATRVHVAERGEDPRKYMLVAFGGAGPVHAHAIVKALKLPGFICPRSAGVASALGFLTAPIAFDFARSFITRLDRIDLAALDRTYAAMEDEAHAVLDTAGVPRDDVQLVRSADLRHVGQGHEITVELPEGAAADGEAALDAITKAFYVEYERLFGHAHPDVAVEILTCRVRASGPVPTVDLETPPADPSSADRARKGSRPVFFTDAGDFVETGVYDRATLAPGATIDGPAIVEEVDCTVVVPPGMRADVDGDRNLVITFHAAEEGGR